MKKSVYVLALMAFAGVASAQDYMSVGVGSGKAKYSKYEFVNPRITGMVQDNNKPTVTDFSVAYGRQEADYRKELELTLGQQAEFTSYHSPFNANAQVKAVTSHRAMANFYKDFPSVSSVNAFVGAGVGLAYNSAEGFQGANRDPFESKSTFALAYSLTAGAKLSVDKYNSLIVAYQYVDAGHANTGKSNFAPFDEQFKGKYVTKGLKFTYTKNF